MIVTCKICKLPFAGQEGTDPNEFCKCILDYVNNLRLPMGIDMVAVSASDIKLNLDAISDKEERAQVDVAVALREGEGIGFQNCANFLRIRAMQLRGYTLDHDDLKALADQLQSTGDALRQSSKCVVLTEGQK